jgi:thioesterase domain-containing protein
MARRLRESGDEVGLVGLFDTMMSPLRWPVHTWFSIFQNRLKRTPAARSMTPVDTWPEWTRRTIGRVREGLRGYRRLASILHVTVRALVASARYRPGFYSGELTLFSPVGRDPGLPSLRTVWSKHARTVSVVETAGEHFSMLSAPNAEVAAASLTRLLPV